MTKRIEVEIYRRHHNGVTADGQRVTVKPGQRYHATEKEFKAFKDRMRLPTAEAENVEPDNTELNELRAKLDALDVKYAPNAGVKALRKKVEEAEGGTE